MDYDKEDNAKYAMNSTKGFRFAASTRGISKSNSIKFLAVRYSENTKNNQPQ